MKHAIIAVLYTINSVKYFLTIDSPVQACVINGTKSPSARIASYSREIKPQTLMVNLSSTTLRNSANGSESMVLL